MKTTKKCPKCGSEEIVTAAVDDNVIRLGVTSLSAVYVTQYICCGCGYSEQWLNRDSLLRARERYAKNTSK